MLTDDARRQTAKERVAPLRLATAIGDDVLLVHEVYTSLQGEGTRAGERCVFIRLTGCHLRCHYCDTEHAFAGGEPQSIASLVEEVGKQAPAHVLLTGGEPLLQKGARPLVAALCDAGHTVLIETSGGVSTRGIDPRAVVILDVKTPSSGEVERNVWSNLDRLRPHDEVKFVIGDAADYAFTLEVIRERLLDGERPKATLLLSPQVLPDGGLSAADLSAWMLRDRVPARLSMQLHKVIWGNARGV